jgi:nicotinamidase-related amidase
VTRTPIDKENPLPLTKLDDKSALVVIDLQKGIAGLQSVHPMSEIINRSAQLARAFRDRGMPVVLLNATGRAPGRTDAGNPKFAFASDWTQLVPELEARAEDYLISKERWGAFLGTDLNEYLRGKGVTQIVLTGVATSIGVESTARSAYDLGYNVTLVVDAMTDMSTDAHRYSVEKLFPRLGETAETADVLKLINEGSPTPAS